MKVALATLAADQRDVIGARLVRLLRGSGYRASRWHELVVCVTPDGDRVVRRMQFAHELHAAGLVEAAHEATARRVRPGEVLTYILRDDDERAGHAFLVVDLRGE